MVCIDIPYLRIDIVINYTLRSPFFAPMLPQAQSAGIVQLILALVYDLSLHSVWPNYFFDIALFYKTEASSVNFDSFISF